VELGGSPFSISVISVMTAIVILMMGRKSEEEKVATDERKWAEMGGMQS